MTEHFHFDLPPDWEDRTVYVFCGPKLGEVEHTLMLTIDRGGRHVEVSAFAEEQTRPIVENVQGLEVLEDQDITREDGNPTHAFVVKWIPGDGVVIYKRYIFVLAGGLGFAFTCDFSKKSFQELVPQMDDLIERLVPGTFVVAASEDPWGR